MLWALPTVTASGLVLEVGHNDPASCETLGESFDLYKESSLQATWSPEIIVGGKTYSKEMLFGSSQPHSSCFSVYYAFY